MIKWIPYTLPAHWRKWGGRLLITLPGSDVEIAINIKYGGFYKDRPPT